MMMRGGLLGDYHIMRPGKDFPSEDIVRGPAAPGDAGLWQEPEDGRHANPFTANPLRQVADTSRSDATQRGLFDSDEDLAAYLARLTSPPEPYTLDHDFRLAPNVSARLSAQAQPRGTGYGQGASAPAVTPNAQLNLGPLSLNGGLTLQEATNDQGNPYSRVAPNFGAGMRVPLAGGEAEAGFKLTPGQLLQLNAEYRRKLLGGDLSIKGSYGQPNEGAPSWDIGARWGRKF